MRAPRLSREIGVEDGGLLAQGAHLPFAYHRSLGEHEDMPADIFDEPELVLDEDNGDAAVGHFQQVL